MQADDLMWGAEPPCGEGWFFWKTKEDSAPCVWRAYYVTTWEGIK